MLLNNKIFNAKTPWACQGVFDKRIKRIKISVAGGYNMQHIHFIIFEKEIFFLNLETFLEDCVSEGLLTRWCFKYHKTPSSDLHYHVWLESEGNSAYRIASFLMGRGIFVVNKDKECLRYIINDFDKKSVIKSNFDVKGAFKL